MPLFEYRCNSCGKRFTALVGVVAGSANPACPKCGGSDLAKLVSRFSTARSDEDAFENIADEADPDDPSSMRKLMREMKGELGDEFGEEFEEALDAADAEDDAEDLI